MKVQKLLAVLLVLCVIAGMSPARATVIEYELTSLGGDQWRYDYFVHNDTLGTSLDWFSLFFDLGDYEDLSGEIAPLGWDPLIQQPDPGLPDDGIFDLFASTGGIAAGATESGFSIVFRWLGGATPGSQRFDVIGLDPGAPLESGITVRRPGAAVNEPRSLALALLGLGLRRQRSRLPALATVTR
jgi:hypothetical protein